MNSAAKASLHQLAKAEEDYYLEAETYTLNRAGLTNVTGWTVEDSVSITLIPGQPQLHLTARQTRLPKAVPPVGLAID